MDYLGLLTLGVFVGAIGAIGVRYINSVESWQKVLLAVLPAVLSGVAVAFVDRFKSSPALGCYPLGLVVAFMWTYSDVAVKNIARLKLDTKDDSSGGFKGQRAIGLLHIAAAALVTSTAIALVVPPTLAQVIAEMSIKPEANIDYLLRQREQILIASAPATKAAQSVSKPTESSASKPLP
jgi:hypothetical protein